MFIPLLSRASNSSTVLLYRPFFRSIVLLCDAVSFGSVSISIVADRKSSGIRVSIVWMTLKKQVLDHLNVVQTLRRVLTLRMGHVYLVRITQFREGAKHFIDDS